MAAWLRALASAPPDTVYLRMLSLWTRTPANDNVCVSALVGTNRFR